MVVLLCALVVVVGFVAIAVAGVRLGREDAALRAQGRPSLFRSPRVRAAMPLLPEGHRPPPGLGPLSPSERFLTTEATRGLRELQLFLADHRRPA